MQIQHAGGSRRDERPSRRSRSPLSFVLAVVLPIALSRRAVADRVVFEERAEVHHDVSPPLRDIRPKPLRIGPRREIPIKRPRPPGGGKFEADPGLQSFAAPL